jgi:hypothetical protein
MCFSGGVPEVVINKCKEIESKRAQHSGAGGISLLSGGTHAVAITIN